jgi:non-lysosomal glucosylceramidase
MVFSLTAAFSQMSSAVILPGLMSELSKLIIPSDAWVIPIGKRFPDDGYPEISFRIPWEQIQMTRDGARQGCPIGGMGAGSIGRTYFGDFGRWQIIPYEHIYDNEVYGTQFHLFVQPEGSRRPFIQTLMAGSPEDSTRSSLSNILLKWPWNYPEEQGVYAALFPKVWCDYSLHPENPIEIILEQFSPVIPHNYYSSSLPLGIYTWHLYNPLNVPVKVGILFSFENLIGRIPQERNLTRNLGDLSQCRWAEKMPEVRQEHNVVKERGVLGITLSCNIDDLRDLPLSRRGGFAIAARKTTTSELTYLLSFDCRGDGSELADTFFKDGRLPDGRKHFQGMAGTLNGAAVCATLTLQPGEKEEVPMALAWDFPEIMISEHEGRIFKRKYTEYKKGPGINAFEFAIKGLEQRKEWSFRIDRWHDEVRRSADHDPVLVKTILNEQYYLLDGGTLWEAGTDNFGLLESIDYFNYETLDVRFYYSFSILRFWPALEDNVMKLFAEGILREDKRIVPWKYGYDYGCQSPEDIKEDIRMARGACPHDLGRPSPQPLSVRENVEAPFVHLNAYSYRNVNLWKDLNTKYVLMVYRNYYLNPAKDIQTLRRHWEPAVEAMQYLQQFDTDGDFIPENSGFPDHTYDSAWHMKGLSAYCGGLWLAALEAMIEIGKILDETSRTEEYLHWLAVGKKSFHEKLWNGEYYNCYEGCSDVMADQLAGQWYADILDLPPIDDIEYIISAYRSIYRYNCLNYFNGERGCVTGITTKGIIPDEEQTPEVWIGINYSLASAFMMRGLREEARQIIKGVHSLIWEKSGLWWATPEALLCEEVTQERLERVYEFIRTKKGKDWMPPKAYTVEELRGKKILQMRAPQYSRPMASAVLLYTLDKQPPSSP